jgi:hypothetical protein
MGQNRKGRDDCDLIPSDTVISVESLSKRYLICRFAIAASALAAERSAPPSSENEPSDASDMSRPCRMEKIGGDVSP